MGCPPGLVQGVCHWDVIDTYHLGRFLEREMLTLEDLGGLVPGWSRINPRRLRNLVPGWSRRCPLGAPLVVSVMAFIGPGPFHVGVDRGRSDFRDFYVFLSYHLLPILFVFRSAILSKIFLVVATTLKTLQ